MVVNAGDVLDSLYDPYVSSPYNYNLIPLLTDSDHGRRRITSILVCHFMLYLREFDSNVSATFSLPEIQGSQIREHVGSTFLEFSASPSHNLPTFIASFANPVHVHSDDWFNTSSDTDVIGHCTSNLEAAAGLSRELDAVSRQGHGPGPRQLSPTAIAE